MEQVADDVAATKTVLDGVSGKIKTIMSSFLSWRRLILVQKELVKTIAEIEKSVEELMTFDDIYERGANNMRTLNPHHDRDRSYLSVDSPVSEESDGEN